MQDELLELRKELDFYRGIVSPGDREPGLRIQRFQLEPDTETGRVFYSLTLTQVILEREKQQGGFLPRSVLTGLVRAGGDTLTNLSRAMGSPIDLLRQVDEEIESRLESLVRRGELAEEEVRRLRDKLLSQDFPHPRRSGPSQDELEQALLKRGVPTQDELDKLSQQLDALAEKLDGLSENEESQKG